MYQQNGPPLPMDEQLRRSHESQALFTVSVLHMDLRIILAGIVWMELLFLRRRRLHLSSCRRALGAHHDTARHGRLFVHKQYANECTLWSTYRYWNH